MGICEASGVQFEDSDEGIKNERAITVRIIERVVGKSTVATTPERPTTARVEQATGIENILQELSEAVKACVQAYMEENKRFWTYLQHFEAQKHQFAWYMKSKDANFLESLLQQFNFREAKEAAPVEESEDADAAE